MTLRFARIVASTVAMVGFFVFCGNAGVAADFELNEEQIAAAVELGTTKFDQDQTAFRWDYIKNLGFGYPHILLRTEFLAVADYVRRSEYQREYGSQKIHELTAERIENARREVDGLLQFLVTVYGPSESFMEGYNFELLAGDVSIQPDYVDKPVIADASGFQGKLSYSATIIIDFPTDALSGKEHVILIIDPPDGLGPSGSRDANFEAPFDLSAVR